MIDFNLSEEQELLKKTAKDFAKNELLEGAVNRDENKIWPKEQIFEASINTSNMFLFSIVLFFSSFKILIDCFLFLYCVNSSLSTCIA